MPTVSQAKARRHTSSKAVQAPDYAWTDLTYLLHQHRISWAFYVEGGTEPDCEDDRMCCAPIPQQTRRPSYLNPLPGFDTVKAERCA